MIVQYNLKQMQVFYSIAKYGTFKEAAKQLNVSLPAVSIQVKNLEDFLGFRLFNRKGAYLELTQKARDILPIINKLFEQTELLTEKLNSFNTVKTNKVSISMNVTPAQFLCPLLYRYTYKHLPDLELNFYNDDLNAGIAKLRNNDIDMLILGGPSPYNDVLSQKFIEFPIDYIVSADNPILEKQPISLEEFRRLPSIIPPLNSGFSQHIYKFYEDNNIPLPSGKCVMGASFLANFIIDTPYGGFINRLTIQNELEKAKIRILELEKLPSSLNFHIIYIEKSLKNPSFIEFLALLEDIDAFEKFRLAL